MRQHPDAARSMVKSDENDKLNALGSLFDIKPWIASEGNLVCVLANGDSFFRVLSRHFTHEEYFYHWYRMKVMHFVWKRYDQTGKLSWLFPDGLDAEKNFLAEFNQTDLEEVWY